jgi:hypothetical protein
VTVSNIRVLAVVGALSACSVIRSPLHPSLQGAPASDVDSAESRIAGVKGAAVGDLGCPSVEIVLTFNREFANTSEPMYVVEGCGKRSVYAEVCSEYPRCRYLLLSVLQISAPQGSSDGAH